MQKIDRFFRAMAWFCLGAFIGVMCAPIKKGISISIASNNVDTTFGEDDKVVSSVDAEDVADVSETAENADEQEAYTEED